MFQQQKIRVFAMINLDAFQFVRALCIKKNCIPFEPLRCQFAQHALDGIE